LQQQRFFSLQQHLSDSQPFEHPHNQYNSSNVNAFLADGESFSNPWLAKIAITSKIVHG